MGGATTSAGAIPEQAARRRTFAIISHPDAGKTTMTEKMLLFGNALVEAGAVVSKKDRRSTASDWMELEKRRGISVSSTVLRFEHDGKVINLLDTPGHSDFSEDTLRVMSAVDGAVILIDAAKGIESQTLRLFEVARSRGIPLITFINKCDRPGIEPLELLDHIESTLDLMPTAMTWPVGDPGDLLGVIDRRDESFHRFERTPGGRSAEGGEILGLEEACDPGRTGMGPGARGAVSARCRRTRFRSRRGRVGHLDTGLLRLGPDQLRGRTPARGRDRPVPRPFAA